MNMTCLRRMLFCTLLCLLTAAHAHPMPESQLWIDTTPAGMTLTAQLPLNRLEFAFGHDLTTQPATVLDRYADALAAYLLLHVGARSGEVGWQVLRPHLALVDDGSGRRGPAELRATFELRAPAGADPRRPELLVDAITHEVRTHRIQVFLRNDWNAGFAGQAPLLLGEFSYGHNRLAIPLDRVHGGGGMASLFAGGIVHIAEGTDHLLFLLMLLLAAPLAAARGRWAGLRAPGAAVRRTAFVVSAFTLGHTVTLVLGSTGLVTVPEQPVEVAVAATIAIAALHAWRPLFARAEAWMALAFGLVHGMAFSANLSGAGLTPWQHAQALLAFNLGIETMQLIALAVALPPLLVLGALRPVAYGHARRALALLSGALAVAWIAQRLEWVDFGAPAWLGDGGALPLLLAGLLWLGALACVAGRRVCFEDAATSH